MSLPFAHPWALLLLPALALGAWLLRRRGADGVRFGPAPALAGLSSRRARWMARAPGLLRGAAVACLVVAVAGPRTGGTVVEERSDGIAILVALDVSSSMLAQDFRPSRLDAAKATLAEFVAARPGDRIGLVAFAGEALTLVPATADHGILQLAIDGLQVGTLADGTAIGQGLATAANRLRRTEGRSRVVILLSDGENNRGDTDPRDAAKAAAAFGIRVYTVGVGSRGRARVPVARTETGLRYATLPVSIDEPLLTDIARSTGGRYFRATDAAALARVYEEIDRLETSTVQVRRSVAWREWHLPFLLAAAVLLLAEWFGRAGRWGRVP